MYVLKFFKGCEKMAANKKPSTQNSKKELQRVPDKKHSQSKGGKAHKPTYNVPSEKLSNQILPFVFVAIALLLSVCFLFAAITQDKHVGVAGVFIKNVF